MTLERRTFSRFKYAEEFAHLLDMTFPDTVPGWRLSREADVQFVDEDDDEYTVPVYVVEWWTLD